MSYYSDALNIASNAVNYASYAYEYMNSESKEQKQVREEANEMSGNSKQTDTDVDKTREKQIQNNSFDRVIDSVTNAINMFGNYNQKSKEMKRMQEETNERIQKANDEEEALKKQSESLRNSTRKDFEATIECSKQTHEMNKNMMKGLGAATANLYNDLGYFNGPPDDSRSQSGPRIRELEAAPDNANMNTAQNGRSQETKAALECEKMDTASSRDSLDKCWKCDTETKNTYCGHSYCPKCHVREGKLQCPVCKKVYE